MSLSATLLGTGVGIPQIGRSQSGLLIEGDSLLLLDCGAGTLNRLSEAGKSPLDINTVFLSHLHLDHVSDLLALAKARYLMGTSWLSLYGPKDSASWLKALQAIYPYLAEMVISVHELEAGDHLDLGEYSIKTARAVHSVPALAYSISTESRAIVYSGDTEPCPEVAELARGADLLIHECSFPEGMQVSNHTTPRKLGEMVKEVDRIVLTHLYPLAKGREAEMARLVADLAQTRTEVGRDLMRIAL